MRVVPTRLAGVFRLSVDWLVDDRGEFGHAWTASELHLSGLRSDFVQVNVSRTTRALTLRGLHYQLPPSAEAKLVRCTKGAIFDACVDVRPGSASRGEWAGFELRADRDDGLYVSEGIAHGFMSLLDATEVHYSSTSFHDPERERGIRWDDPTIGISWPVRPLLVSAKDRAWPDLSAASEGEPV